MAGNDQLCNAMGFCAQVVQCFAENGKLVKSLSVAHPVQQGAAEGMGWQFFRNGLTALLALTPHLEVLDCYNLKEIFCPGREHLHLEEVPVTTVTPPQYALQWKLAGSHAASPQSPELPNKLGHHCVKHGLRAIIACPRAVQSDRSHVSQLQPFPSVNERVLPNRPCCCHAQSGYSHPKPHQAGNSASLRCH